jgi:hypothetical protein
MPKARAIATKQMHKGASAVVFERLKVDYPDIRKTGFAKMLRELWALMDVDWRSEVDEDGNPCFDSLSDYAVSAHGIDPALPIGIVPDGWRLELDTTGSHELLVFEIDDTHQMGEQKAATYVALSELLWAHGVALDLVVVDRVGSTETWDPEQYYMRAFVDPHARATRSANMSCSRSPP